MLSYEASRFANETLKEGLTQSLSYIRNLKNHLINKEISPFVQKLPTEKSALTKVYQDLTQELSKLQSNDHIKTIRGLHTHCEEQIKSCLEQGRKEAADLISKQLEVYKRALNEHCEDVAIADAKVKSVESLLKKVSEQKDKQIQEPTIIRCDQVNNLSDTQKTLDVTHTGLTLDEVTFAEKHGLLPKPDIEILAEQAEAIKALHHGYTENNVCIIQDVQQINLLSENKLACAKLSPQASEYYDSAITCTSGALKEYLQSNCKEALLLDKYAASFTKMAEATVQITKCVCNCTEGMVLTIISNTIDLVNVPKLWQTGKEFIKFGIINGMKTEMLSQESRLNFIAGAAKSFGCSQEVADRLLQASKAYKQASDTLIKTSLDLLVEHAPELFNKVVQDFKEAPIELKAKTFGNCCGHIATALATPLLIGKVSKATTLAAQCIAKSELWKEASLAAQLFYKTEISQLVKFGGKIIEHDIASKLLKLKNELLELGISPKVLTDEIIAKDFLETTNPLSYHVTNWFETKHPELFGEFSSSIKAFPGETKNIEKISSELNQSQQKISDISKQVVQQEQKISDNPQVITKIQDVEQSIKKQSTEVNKVSDSLKQESTSSQTSDILQQLNGLHAHEVPQKIMNEVLEGLYLDDAAIGHMSDLREGHIIIDSTIKKDMLLNTAKDAKNFLGIDRRGNWWFAKNLENGTQIWIQARANTRRIFNGGINLTPKLFNKETGLSKLINSGK